MVGEGIRRSVSYQVAKELVRGPVRGGCVAALHMATRGRLFPRLREFAFHKKRELSEVSSEFSWQNLPQALAAFDARFPSSEKTGHFIGDAAYTGFSQASDSLQQKLRERDPELRFTDYVLATDEGHVLFYETQASQGRQGRVLRQIKVDAETYSLETIQAQVEPSVDDFFIESGPTVLRNLAIEDAIEAIQKRDGIQGKLFRISPITNDFSAVRNALYDPEGEMFERLHDQGVSSLGELVEAQQQLFDTMRVEVGADDSENFVFHAGLVNVWIQTWKEAYQGSDGEAIGVLLSQANEMMYSQMVDMYLREHPQLVSRFRQSILYLRHADAFKDIYLATAGQTETDVARSMLVNYYLFKFEGYETPQESPTQQFFSRKSSDFYAEVDHFVSLQRGTDGFLEPATVARSDRELLIDYRLEEGRKKISDTLAQRVVSSAGPVDTSALRREFVQD